MRVEASIVVNGGEEGRNVGLSVERREEDVITGITSDVGELGVEAGSEEARCRQKAAKESMMVLQSEERMKECDSRGELGDMGVVAGGGAESQDQEVRAQRNRRELGGEERRHRRRRCVICICYFWVARNSIRMHHIQLADTVARRCTTTLQAGLGARR